MKFSDEKKQITGPPGCASSFPQFTGNNFIQESLVGKRRKIFEEVLKVSMNTQLVLKNISEWLF